MSRQACLHVPHRRVCRIAERLQPPGDCSHVSVAAAVGRTDGCPPRLGRRCDHQLPIGEMRRALAGAVQMAAWSLGVVWLHYRVRRHALSLKVVTRVAGVSWVSGWLPLQTGWDTAA